MKGMTKEEFFKLKPGMLIQDSSGDFFMISSWWIRDHGTKIVVHPIPKSRRLNEWHGWLDFSPKPSIANIEVHGTLDRSYFWDLVFSPWEGMKRVA